MIEQLFFELIRVALGNAVSLSHKPSDKEWKQLYGMAKKQSLVGICFAAIQRLQEETRPPEMLCLTWMGMAAKIQQRNEVMNSATQKALELFRKDGFYCTVLKGQGIAKLYKPMVSDVSKVSDLQNLRQSGDIDVLVDCDFVRAASFAKSSTDINVKWAYKDISLPIFQDTEVELHIKPGLMFNPIHNRTW